MTRKRRERFILLCKELQNEIDFTVHFDDHLPLGGQGDQENNTSACEPLRVITKSVPNSSKVGRKMSARDFMMRKKAMKGCHPAVSMLPG